MNRIICVGWATKQLYQLVGNTWELSPIDPGIPLSAGLWGGPNGTLWAHRHPSPGGFLFYNGNNWSEPGWTMGYEDSAPWSMHGTADGSRIYAVSNGNIWRYDGVIWQHAKALSPTLKSVWCNDSGRHVIIGATRSEFWYSDDYGATWSDLYPDAVSQTGLDPIGRCLAPWGVSDDGDECRIYLGTNGRYLLRYNTASNAWTHLTTAAHSFQGGLVGDESKFLAILSQNMGSKWIYSIVGAVHTAVHEFPGDASPESSIDGRRMFATEGEIACGLESGPGSNYYARRSIDGGSTWTEVPSGTQVDIYNFAAYDDGPLPPILQNRDPYPNETNVLLDYNISFDVVDEYGGVNLSTLDAYVDGSLAFDSGAFQAPYNGVDAYVGAVQYDNYDGYTFIIDNTNLWTPLAQVSVRVVAEDLLGNSLDETWYFYAEPQPYSVSIDIEEGYGSGFSSAYDGTSFVSPYNNGSYINKENDGYNFVIRKQGLLDLGRVSVSVSVEGYASSIYEVSPQQDIDVSRSSEIKFRVVK